MDELRKHFNFRLPPSLVARVDRVVAGPGGSTTRTDFVEKAIGEKLAEFEVFGRFECPLPTCDYKSDSPAAICAAHGRKVQPGGQLPV